MKQIIYHSNCFDGHCAAWLCHLAWPDAEFVPANFGWSPPNTTGKDVLIFDFCYPRDKLLEMHKKSRTLYVFDHHESMREEMAGLSFCSYNENKSGARLAWDYLIDMGHLDPNWNKSFWERFLYEYISQSNIHWLVQYVEDRDLGKKVLPYAREINAAVRSYPMNFETWDELAKRSSKSFIIEGKSILRFQQKIIDHHLRFLQWVEIDGIMGKGCSCSVAKMYSDIMDQIMKNESVPFAAVWCDTFNGDRIYSLRSPESGVDVGVLAKKYNGGGHPHASSFRVPLTLTLQGNSPVHSKIF